MDNSIHPKTRHRCIRCAMKKSKKQQQILKEVKVSAYIKTNILTTKDIADNVLVFDGGDCNSIPIKPPDGINWTRISVLEDKCVIAIDETDPHRGLTIGPIHQCHAYIRMPRFQRLCILGNSGMTWVMNALLALETLRKISFLRSTKKKYFGDYGKEIMYTYAGVQVSQNSRQVLQAAPLWTDLLSVTGEC
jgi:hypothetical protein